jgi:glucokinase
MTDQEVMNQGTVLGIDIGGTKMAAALVSADGRILTGDRIMTPPGDADEVFAALAELIDRVRWTSSTGWCHR